MNNPSTLSGVGTIRVPGLGRHFREIWQHKVLYLFIIPAVVVTLVFNYRPMYGVVMAFQKYDIMKGIGGSQFIGLDNFKEFIASPDFYVALRNTIALNLLGLMTFPLPIVFAILINEFSWMRFKKTVQSITYLPHFISWVIVAGLFYKMLDQDTGIVNLLLQKLGCQSIGFFREPNYFWGILTLTGIWKELGWASILYLSAITAINPEIYEAAIVDGAGRLKRIWYVTLPGIMSTIVILFVLSVSSLLSGGNFEAVMVLRNAMTADTSDIIDVFSYFKGIRMGNYGYATAIGLAQSVLSIIMLFAANKGMKKLTGYSVF